jgi:hypothetical protein
MNGFTCPQSYTSPDNSHSFFTQHQGYPLDFSDSDRSIRDSTSSKEMVTADYISFESLPNLEQNCDFATLATQMKAKFESQNWVDQFEAIRSLRILHKSLPREINFLFEAFAPYITNSLSSPKSCIAKHIIMFAQEVIGMAKESGLNVFIPVNLIRFLIPRTASSNKLIKDAAEHAMNLLTENCLSDETIKGLCEGACSSHKIFKERSFHFLQLALSTMREAIANVQPETLDAIVLTVINVITTGQIAMQKSISKNIVLYIYRLMGNENYMCYVDLLMRKEKINLAQANLLAEIATHEKAPRPSFAQALRDMRRSSCGPNSRPYSVTDVTVTINGYQCN